MSSRHPALPSSGNPSNQPQSSISRSDNSGVVTVRHRSQGTNLQGPPTEHLAQPARRRAFVPMDCVRGTNHANTTMEGTTQQSISNQSARNRPQEVSEHENCSLILTNLPRGTSEKVLLDALSLHRPLGKVWGCSVTPTAPGYQTAAANLTMFTREAAHNVFALVNGGHLSIGGLVVRICYNTARPFSPQGIPAYVSRVLVIRGNKDIVDVHRLHHFLSRNMMFQTQDVYVVEANAEERIIEWVFGTYRAQAATARMALRSEYPQLTLRCGVDPMAATLAERTVATVAVVPAAILHIVEAVVHDNNDDMGNEAGSETSDLITFD